MGHRCAGAGLRRSRRTGGRCYAGQWLENSAEQDVKLPLERCFEMWEDRERIPQWMPWIQTVKVRLCLSGSHGLLAVLNSNSPRNA